MFKFGERPVRFDVLGEGPPLVIVHGTPWSSFNLRRLIRPLSKSFTVYTYDLIGYGESDMSDGDVSLKAQDQLLNALLKHWGLESPAIIGHDFGGATTLRTAILHQHSFRKIVLINAVALSPWGSPFFMHVREHQQAFAGVPDYIHEAIVRAYINTAVYKPLTEEVLNKTIQPWLSDAGKAAFYRQIAQADSTFTDDVQASYKDISSPTLIVWGENDEWIPIAKGRALHDAIPASIFHPIANAGHLVIEEQADPLLEKIIPFLAN